MDITLNDGTEARNVSVDEYTQLKQQGLVGNNGVVQTNQASNVPPAAIKYPDGAVTPIFDGVVK